MSSIKSDHIYLNKHPGRLFIFYFLTFFVFSHTFLISLFSINKHCSNFIPSIYDFLGGRGVCLFEAGHLMFLSIRVGVYSNKHSNCAQSSQIIQVKENISSQILAPIECCCSKTQKDSSLEALY